MRLPCMRICRAIGAALQQLKISNNAEMVAIGTNIFDKLVRMCLKKILQTRQDPKFIEIVHRMCLSGFLQCGTTYVTDIVDRLPTLQGKHKELALNVLSVVSHEHTVRLCGICVPSGAHVCWSQDRCLGNRAGVLCEVQYCPDPRRSTTL